MSVSPAPAVEPKLRKLRDLLTGSDGAVRCGSCTRKEEEVKVLVFLGLIALCDRCIDNATAGLAEYRGLVGVGFDKVYVTQDIEEGQIVAPPQGGASKELASGLNSPCGPDSQAERVTWEPEAPLPTLPRGGQTILEGISPAQRALARRAVAKLLHQKPLSRVQIEAWAERLAADVLQATD